MTPPGVGADRAHRDGDRRRAAEAARAGAAGADRHAVTAYANPEDRVRALVAGYQNHIPKPVDVNVLAAAIAKLVAR